MRERHRYEAGGRRAAAILALAALLTAGVAIAGPSEDIVYGGIVERVANGAVYVNGKEFQITGVPVKNLNGKNVAFHEIVPGKYAQIHTTRGRILEVLVFDPIPR
jgi:hypothetical protein